MSAIAHERAVQRVPGFLAITWAVFVGFVLAAISVGVVGGAAFLIGFVGRDPSTHVPAAAIYWPFTHSGAWSITANAVITAGVLFISAYWIAERVSHRSAEPVSLARTFAIVLVTGYAPYVGYRGLLPLHFVLGLLATAFLVRRYALGFPPLELAPRTRLVLGVAGVTALCVPAAYGATHPLWYQSEVAVRGPTHGPNWAQHRVVFLPRRAQIVTYGFLLKNVGFGRVTLLGVSGGSTPLLRVVGAESGIMQRGFRGGALRGTSVHRNREQFVTLFIRLLGCDQASGTATLDRVTVRYRLAGMTFSQPMALAIRPTISCQGS